MLYRSRCLTYLHFCIFSCGYLFFLSINPKPQRSIHFIQVLFLQVLQIEITPTTNTFQTKYPKTQQKTNHHPTRLGVRRASARAPHTVPQAQCPDHQRRPHALTGRGGALGFCLALDGKRKPALGCLGFNFLFLGLFWGVGVFWVCFCFFLFFLFYLFCCCIFFAFDFCFCSLLLNGL